MGARHPGVASDRTELAAILLDGGDARAALPILADAVDLQARVRDDGSLEVVTARTLLAEALLATGAGERAVAEARRAVDAAHPRGDYDGRARFALARALDASDRPAALALARAARERLRGWALPDDVARIDRWLAGRAPAH
jgi:hypothetical protein